MCSKISQGILSKICSGVALGYCTRVLLVIPVKDSLENFFNKSYVYFFSKFLSKNPLGIPAAVSRKKKHRQLLEKCPQRFFQILKYGNFNKYILWKSFWNSSILVVIPAWISLYMFLNNSPSNSFFKEFVVLFQKWLILPRVHRNRSSRNAFENLFFLEFIWEFVKGKFQKFPENFLP